MELCVLCAGSKQCCNGLFPTVWISPTRYFPKEVFSMWVWAHPSKLILSVLAPTLLGRSYVFSSSWLF